ncbi:hypothetical protein B0H66DRAFT_622801 [Apodospora peruviana]|uniref:Uncharacterized protein n=1 Tax=Apodospora peruviana TaxID=516989 RepID=A0AAE0I544_9PEZI|nr:hypothetical protein B0H66DRAFT_622801 [Apodospora peruviana]
MAYKHSIKWFLGVHCFAVRFVPGWHGLGCGLIEQESRKLYPSRSAAAFIQCRWCAHPLSRCNASFPLYASTPIAPDADFPRKYQQPRLSRYDDILPSSHSLAPIPDPAETPHIHACLCKGHRSTPLEETLRPRLYGPGGQAEDPLSSPDFQPPQHCIPYDMAQGSVLFSGSLSESNDQPI